MIATEIWRFEIEREWSTIISWDWLLFLQFLTPWYPSIHHGALSPWFFDIIRWKFGNALIDILYDFYRNMRLRYWKGAKHNHFLWLIVVFAIIDSVVPHHGALSPWFFPYIWLKTWQRVDCYIICSQPKYEAWCIISCIISLIFRQVVDWCLSNSDWK